MVLARVRVRMNRRSLTPGFSKVPRHLQFMFRAKIKLRLRIGLGSGLEIGLEIGFRGYG